MRDDARGEPLIALLSVSALAPGGGRLDGMNLELHPGEIASAEGWGPAAEALVGVMSGSLRLRQGSVRPQPAAVAVIREASMPLPGPTLLHAVAAVVATRQGHAGIWLRSSVSALGAKAMGEVWHALDRTELSAIAARSARRLDRVEALLLRLAIATAARQRILVLDGIAHGLDTTGLARIGRVLRALCEDGTAVLLAGSEPGLSSRADARHLPSPVAVPGV